MKKTFLFLLAVVISMAASAQMQVWSNGTIIFSHDQTDVDSISFGSPMQVQTRMQSATTPTLLVGSVYVSSLSGAGSNNSLYALCFLDESNGYYCYNSYGTPGHYDENKMIAFTYSISGSDITINIQGANKTGKIIGKNGIVISNWYYYDTTGSAKGYYPATFLNYNR